MKKLVVIAVWSAGILLMSCHASVHTPKTDTDVKVGNAYPVHHTVVKDQAKG